MESHRLLKEPDEDCRCVFCYPRQGAVTLRAPGVTDRRYPLPPASARRLLASAWRFR
jgi:hypothetical protein